jgi:hypothetical protein
MGRQDLAIGVPDLEAAVGDDGGAGGIEEADGLGVGGDGGEEAAADIEGEGEV